MSGSSASIRSLDTCSTSRRKYHNASDMTSFRVSLGSPRFRRRDSITCNTSVSSGVRLIVTVFASLADRRVLVTDQTSFLTFCELYHKYIFMYLCFGAGADTIQP